MERRRSQPIGQSRGYASSRHRWRLRVACASLALALPLLLACGAAPAVPAPSGSPAAGAAAAPTPGGDLISSVSTRYIDVLDPNVTAQTVSHYIMGPIFDTLVVQANDGQFFPALATKWEVSPDGLT